MSRTDHVRRGWQSSTYRAWRDMLSRCRNAKHKSYPNYGGRGIFVCERWLSFDNFLADMGAKPDVTPKLTLERVDNARNYEPGNCCWATYRAQERNKRVTKLTLDTAQEILGRIEHGEHPRSVSVRMGISLSTVLDVKNGYTWTELDRSNIPMARWPRRAQRRLTLDDALEAIGRFEHGESIASIVKRMKSTPGCISALIHGRSWKSIERPYLARIP